MKSLMRLPSASPEDGQGGVQWSGQDGVGGCKSTSSRNALRAAEDKVRSREKPGQGGSRA